MAVADGAAEATPRKPKVVILTGPTAVGKTNVSLKLAEAIGGEIISADSVQVYRGLDVGSDKISFAERRGIPHHLIDVLEPTEDFSAGDFYRLAREATEQILQRGKVPIVVGGTGFYLRWYVHGRPNTPTSNPEGAAKVQAFLEKEEAAAISERGPLSQEELWDVYAAAVEGLGDKASAARLRAEPNNRYRLKRILEILLTTGQPLGALDHDRKAPLDYDFRCFFLERPRTELYGRIGRRCEEMLANGLLHEAAWLRNLGLHAGDNCATKAIGYRQALEFLESSDTTAESFSPATALVQLAKDIQAKSRNLCHHQLSWFRDEELFHWLDATRPTSEIVTAIVQHIQADEHSGKQSDRGRLTKEEAKALRAYLYRQEMVCQPEVQKRIMTDLQNFSERTRP